MMVKEEDGRGGEGGGRRGAGPGGLQQSIERAPPAAPGFIG